MTVREEVALQSVMVGYGSLKGYSRKFYYLKVLYLPLLLATHLPYLTHLLMYCQYIAVSTENFLWQPITHPLLIFYAIF